MIALPCVTLVLFVQTADVVVAAEDASHGGLHEEEIRTEALLFRILSTVFSGLTLPAFAYVTKRFAKPERGHSAQLARSSKGSHSHGSVALWHSIQSVVSLILFVSPAAVSMMGTVCLVLTDNIEHGVVCGRLRSTMAIGCALTLPPLLWTHLLNY